MEKETELTDEMLLHDGLLLLDRAFALIEKIRSESGEALSHMVHSAIVYGEKQYELNYLEVSCFSNRRVESKL